MTDLRPDFALGENVLKTTEDQSTAAVELAEDVIAGEALYVTGVNAEGLDIVRIIDLDTDDVKYIAMETGSTGDIARVLHKGRTKLTYGDDTILAGSRLVFVPLTSEVELASANATVFVKAVAVDPGDDGDLGFVDFDGGITPLGTPAS